MRDEGLRIYPMSLDLALQGICYTSPVSLSPLPLHITLSYYSVKELLPEGLVTVAPLSALDSVQTDKHTRVVVPGS